MHSDSDGWKHQGGQKRKLAPLPSPKSDSDSDGWKPQGGQKRRFASLSDFGGAKKKRIVDESGNFSMSDDDW